VPKFTGAQNQLIIVEIISEGVSIKSRNGTLTFSYVEPAQLAVAFKLESTQQVQEQFSAPVNDLPGAAPFPASAMTIVTNAFGQQALQLTSQFTPSVPARQALVSGNSSRMVGQSTYVVFSTSTSSSNYGQIMELSLVSDPLDSYFFSLRASVEQSSRQLYMVYNTTDEYTVRSTSCKYLDNVLYRLQLDVLSPGKAGTGYRVRAMLTSSSANSMCTILYKPYGFRETAFQASKFRIAISQSNMAYTNVQVQSKRQSGTNTMTIAVSEIASGCQSSCTTIPANVLPVVIALIVIGVVLLFIAAVIIIASLIVYWYKKKHVPLASEFVGVNEVELPVTRRKVEW
jgi:hypothetical protein